MTDSLAFEEAAVGEQEALKEWLESRGTIYRLLGNLYQEAPSLTLLSWLTSAEVLPALASETRFPPLANGYRLMLGDLIQHEGGLDSHRQDLVCEYNRLFVGPSRLPAPPWESVYLSTEHVVFGEQTRAVRDFYSAFGLASRTQGSEPEDHVGLELEFAARLCQMAETRLRNGEDPETHLSALERFFREHLAAWVPRFCAAVENSTVLPFYRGLAQFTRGFLGAEAAAMGMDSLPLVGVDSQAQG